MLHGLGACVSVAARRYDDLNSIAAHGHKAIAIESLTDTLPSFRVIFNTVPALLFNKTALERTQTDVLLIDLASAPGGIDFDAAEQLKRKSIQALGLPGKSAPETAGKIICDTVLNYLHETEVIE